MAAVANSMLPENLDQNEHYETRNTLDLQRNLTQKEKDYFWEGNLPQLKSFVEKTLKIDGSWSSPGGEAKLFKGENVILKWHGPTRKKLVVQEDREDCSVESILQCLCRGVEKSQIDTEISIEASEGINMQRSSINKTELASLKLELSTVWAVVDRIQDTILVKLDDVNSNKERQLVKIRSELDKARLERESQIKLLNVKLDDISGDRECVETSSKLSDLKDANCELINENSRLKNVNYEL